jgi:hypothetical protein
MSEGCKGRSRVRFFHISSRKAVIGSDDMPLSCLNRHPSKPKSSNAKFIKAKNAYNRD